VDPRVRQLMISVPGWAAEMEREFIRERTREAIARLKAQGKAVGRPPKWSEATRRRIIDLVRRGITLRGHVSWWAWGTGLRLNTCHATRSTSRRGSRGG
jgi:DNA invertase Pin-like site-specific DNA recombinase